jgi:solute carrier family 25 oxoglutarate transporter 11
MQSDGRLPFADRRNYKHAVDALVRIRREEGAATYAAAGAATESIGRTIGARTRLRCRYWRGCTPTVARAMVVSATQLATYDSVRCAADPPTLSLRMHA